MTRKRDPIKHVRDKAKSSYPKGASCEICGATENLDFHHYNSLTELFELWCRKNSYSITTDEEVLAVRDEFISQHYSELNLEAATLCRDHHQELHQIYGKRPSLGTAGKQKRWVQRQTEKHA